MQRKLNALLLLIILLVASLTSCNFPREDELSEDEILQGTQTVAAQQTQAQENYRHMMETPEAAARQTLQAREIQRQLENMATRDANERGEQQKTQESTAASQLTHGFLNLDVPNASGPNILGGGCWPPQYPNAATGYLKVNAAGDLDGKCNYGQVGSNNEASGELTGKIDTQAGTVTFHLTVTYYLLSSDGTGRVTDDYTVDGYGTIAALGPGEVTGGSGAIAKGSATFVWTCVAEGQGIACGGNPPDYELTAGGAGTVPFRMTFYSENGH